MEEENKTFVEDKRAIIETRKKRIEKYVYLPIVVLIIGTVIYYAAQSQFPTNWASPIIASFISAFLIWLISKTWDRSRIQIEKRVKKHIKKQRDVMELLIESKVSKFRWQFIDQLKSQISAEISKNIHSATNEYFKNHILDPLSPLYEKLKELSIQLKEISTSYSSAAKTISSELTEYYTRTEVNLSVLAKVSAAIRQEEIEPSFVTLNERNNLFGETKKTLLKINITLSSA